MIIYSRINFCYKNNRLYQRLFLLLRVWDDVGTFSWEMFDLEPSFVKQ